MDASLHVQRDLPSRWWLLLSLVDPVFIAAGFREQRLRLFMVVLLFLATLGLDVC